MNEEKPIYYDSNIRCPKCSKFIDERRFIEDYCGCGFRLRITFDYETLKEYVTKKKLRERPFNHLRYREFFPVKNHSNLIDLGAGGTPLIHSHRLAERFGIKQLFLKIETGNPSGSFKDRPISIGVSKAVEHDSETLTAASSGNAAASLATFGARAGKRVVVFVPEHSPGGKLAQLMFLGANVIRVSVAKEGEDPTVTLFKEAYKAFNWTPCPSFGPFNPFQFEGTKSLGFEICEQLEGEVPDWILCPTGSGGLLAGTYKGFLEFEKLGFCNNLPRMVAVQPGECAPIVKAALKKVSPLDFSDWDKTPKTVAGGLADPHPWDAETALEHIYDSKGTGIAVSEEAILRTQKWLAKDEGIFGEPSGTAGLAGLETLINDGTIDSGDFIVVPITGTGFKDPEVVLESQESSPCISPSLEELKLLLEQLRE
ncbi:MAG: threonine synthase [Candidatus Hodarchaeales archaeon]